jgi:hypothetical protein
MNTLDGDDGRRLRKLVMTGWTAVGILLAASAGAVTPADKCESAKLKTAGKYGFCRLLAESKATKTASAPDYSKCDAKYGAKWTAIESKGGGQCPSNGDQTAIQSFVIQHADDLATVLDGGGLQDCPADLAACNADLTEALACGNGTAEGDEDCDGADLNGANCVTVLGFGGGTLACGSGCSFDTSDCWTIRFVDNGDGTVTDRGTELTWEKKTTGVGSGVNLADAHDVDNTYKWSSIVGQAPPDGTAFTDFLYRLNGGTSPDGSVTSGCFAGHCDWRLPTIEELGTILDFGPGCAGGSPCIFAEFGPTQPAFYWSATTLAGAPHTALVVNFSDGLLNADLKGFVYYVRAVRGGS